MLTWYGIFKFLHVGSAILWLGGGLFMIILGLVARRANNEDQMLGVVQQVSWAAERVYIPASVSTLVFGILTTVIGGQWAQLWVILGLLGIASTIFLGIVVLTPRAKRVEGLLKTGGPKAEAVAVSGEILAIARFDMVVLYTVVADMVLKPQWSDWLTLLIFIAVVGAAGYFFMYPLYRPKTAAA